MTPWALTYFSPDYYERIGRESLASLAKHWPGQVVAYYEGVKPEEVYPNVEYRDLLEVSGYTRFIGWAKQVPFLNGFLPDGSHSYHYDVVRFVRRIYAMTDKPEGRFYVVDADVILSKPIPVDALNGWLDGKLGALMFREHIGSPVYYPELSVSGWNMEHPAAGKFLSAYRAVHDNGVFLRMTQGYHDAWILYWLLHEMGVRDQFTDWVNGAFGEGDYKSHVLPVTPLAEYMVHLKGPKRKKQHLSNQEAA